VPDAATAPVSGCETPILIVSCAWTDKAARIAAEPIAIDDRMLGRLHALAGPWTAADRLPALADIPGSGQVVRGGGPVLTVFARGDTGAASVAELRSRVEAVKTVTG
jgi:hypothetical protein